jgi:hypothetical protein
MGRDHLGAVGQTLRLELATVAASLCSPGRSFSEGCVEARHARLISRKHGDAAPWLQQNIWATRPNSSLHLLGSLFLQTRLEKFQDRGFTFP